MAAWNNNLCCRIAENPKFILLLREIGRNSETDVGDFYFGIIPKKLTSHSFGTLF